MYQPVTDKDKADLWSSFEHRQDNLKIDFLLWLLHSVAKHCKAASQTLFFCLGKNLVIRKLTKMKTKRFILIKVSNIFGPLSFAH